MDPIAEEAGREGGLTGKVLEFQRTGRGYREIVGNLALRIYHFPRNRRGCSEDDCGDFYLFFFPRLVRILSRFRDQGKPFEAYLNSVLRWQLKSYIRCRRRSERLWEVSARPELWEPAGEQEEVPRLPEEQFLQRTADLLGTDGRGVIRRPADRRRFLFFALKRVRELSDGALDQAADRLGMPREELRRPARELRGRLERREERLARMRVRRNRAFSRLAQLEQQLPREMDAGRARRLEERIARLRRTLRKTQAVIARIPLQPSNREIGEVLGVPKGSVDTSLFWLRRRLRECDRLERKEYA
jgi:RNA polymerase sigma factor (sigma-70 family)